ncbi:MAG: CRISPR-associated endonuclease Cas2 [Candidatus Kerfeldbacteria bacterium]|nr:CRISPR-associated endonuclease Cas2 [Candidatus Kerfeldbacteria bacterium]
MNKDQPKRTNTKILLALLTQTGQAVIDFYTFLNDVRYHRGTYIRGGSDLVREIKKLQQDKEAKLALRHLREANYIKTKKMGNRLMVTLTAKGFAKSLNIKLRQAAPHPSKFYTVVIFDIPESENLSRRQFRLLLRQGGFIKLQQSVWISKNDTYQLIAGFIKKMKLEPWINIFRATDFLHIPKQ